MFSTWKLEERTQTELNLIAHQGWFVNTKFCLGLNARVYILHQRETVKGFGRTILNEYNRGDAALAPFARYYLPLGKFSFVPELSFPINVYSGYGGQAYPWYSSIGFGANYFISKNLAIELMPTYRLLMDNDIANDGGFGTGLKENGFSSFEGLDDFNVNLGIQLFFGKKKADQTTQNK